MKSTVNNHLRRAAMMLLAALLTTMTASAVTVDESQVTFLTAIKSTGAQAFNTGYTHKANTRVELDCEVTKNSHRNWEALFGGRLGNFTKNAFCFFSRHWNQTSTAEDNPCFNRTGEEKNGEGFVYDQRIKLVCEGQTAKWYKHSNLNTAVGSVMTTGTADDGKTPMFLFNLNTSGTTGGSQPDTSPSVMTLYGCKIYEGETLKCDFVPALYDGKVGLYDRVNKTFGGSITTSSFKSESFPDLNLIGGTELLKNGQCDGTFNSWTKTADGGNGWAIKTFDDGTKCWASSYELCTLTQTVVLSESGFSNTDVDAGKVQCQASADMMSGWAGENIGAKVAEVKVEMLNASGNVLGTITVLNDLSAFAEWTTFKTDIFTLKSGTRKLRCVLSGQDPVGWRDQYGPYYRNVSFKASTKDQTAADVQADYLRALAAIRDGQTYLVYTVYGGQRYYVTADGRLSTNKADAPRFAFTKMKADASEREYEYGFQLRNNGTCFSNPSKEDGTTMEEGHLHTNNDYRKTWESQVFFLNSEGKYAIRSTNAKSATSGWEWVGSAFWTVNACTDGPLAEYSFDMNYVWQLELAEVYPVWLGDKQVTVENKDDVLGDGTVSYEPGDGTGTLTITTATPNITDYSYYGLIYAHDIDLTINAPNGLHLDCPINYYGIRMFKGSLTFNGNLSGSMKYNEIYILNGDFKAVGNIDFSTSNSWGIYVQGNVDIEGNVALRASNQCIEAHSLKVKGNLSVSNQNKNYYAINLYKGGLTVEGNVTGSALKYVIVTSGKVNIIGDLNLTTYSEYASPISTSSDVFIKGNVAIKMDNKGSEGIYAGNITIDGDVKVWGGYWALFADYNLTMVSGRWELDAIDRVLSFSEMTIPDTHEIIVPAGGTVSQYGHILDADGNDVRYAFISQKGDTPPNPTYAITVKGGKAYEDVFSLSELPQIYFAEPDQPVTVVPDLAVGQYVQYWESDVDVEFLSNGSSADFVMPESNVTLTPVYANQHSYGIDVRNGNEMALDEEVYLALLDTYKSKNNSIIFLASNNFDLDGDGNDDIQITKAGGDGCKARALDGTNLTGVFSVTRANSSKYYPINVAFSGATLPTWDGLGTEDHPYIISSAEELDQLAQCVKGIDGELPNSFTGIYFKLGCDITYNHDSDWDDITSTEDNYTPIGFKEGDAEYVFDGQFDGDGHTVSGIRIYKGEQFSCLGLFGNVGRSAGVVNVILDDARITGCNEVGGIVGRNLCWGVSNCHVTANVTIHTGWENARNVGGIVGTNGSISYGASVTECSCAATLSLVDGIQENTGYGGIVGMNYRGTIRGNIVAGATIPTTTYDSSNGYTHGAIIGHQYVDGYNNSYLWRNYYRNISMAVQPVDRSLKSYVKM